MHQFSVRLSDERARGIRELARARGRSVNQTFEDLVTAATDPANAVDDLAALRERLARAGLSFDTAALPEVARPSKRELAEARATAGRGTSLEQLVSERRR